MPKKGYVWVQAPPTFTKDEKDKVYEELKGFIDDSVILKIKEIQPKCEHIVD